MINQQLLDFIKSQLLKGVDKETITKELLGGGWTNEDIEEGLNTVNTPMVSPIINSVIKPSSATKMIDTTKMKEIYNLKNNFNQIKAIQEASLDKKSFAGFIIENNLLFGTDEWFKAIKDGQIKSLIIRGNISRILMSGHNDFPEFEIESSSGYSIWPIEGIENAYKVGHQIELIYIEQRYKRPSDITGAMSNCVLQINVEV